MTNTYNEIYAKVSSKDCTVEELQKIIWKYASEEMMEILKSGKVDVNLVKTLINYRGNSYGAHAMLLDMGFGGLYEDIYGFIMEYASTHENSWHGATCCYDFKDNMDAYISARKTKKIVADKICDNPLIQNLYKNGHRTFANKAIRLLVKGDEENKSANKVQQRALYNMRAYDFFKTLEKVVKELGE